MRILPALMALAAVPILAFAATVPRPALELAFSTPAGKAAKVSDYKGRVIAVEILRTSCPHCQASAKVLAKLKADFGNRGFEAVGLAIENDADLAGFVKQNGVNFPVGIANKDEAFRFLQFSVMQSNFYFPQIVLLDRTGTVRGQYSGVDDFLHPQKEEANLRALIERLLAEGGGTAAGAKTAASKKGAQ